MKSELDELLEEGFTKGLEKGREEALRSRRELLRRQLAQRFGAIPGDLDARLANASTGDVETWSLRLLTAASIGDVFRSE